MGRGILYYAMGKLITWSESSQACLCVLKPKLKRKCSRNKQEPKTAVVKVWQSITHGETQHLVMSVSGCNEFISDEVKSKVVLLPDFKSITAEFRKNYKFQVTVSVDGWVWVFLKHRRYLISVLPCFHRWQPGWLSQMRLCLRKHYFIFQL